MLKVSCGAIHLFWSQSITKATQRLRGFWIWKKKSQKRMFINSGQDSSPINMNTEQCRHICSLENFSYMPYPSAMERYDKGYAWLQQPLLQFILEGLSKSNIAMEDTTRSWALLFILLIYHVKVNYYISFPQMYIQMYHSSFHRRQSVASSQTYTKLMKKWMQETI